MRHKIHEGLKGLFGKGHPDRTHIGRIDFKDGVVIVRVKGSVTFDTVNDADVEHIKFFKGKKIRSIVADFAGVVDIDTAVIVALVKRLKEMRSESGEGKIGLINLPAKMRSLLDISRTKEIFREYRSEEEAVEDLRQGSSTAEKKAVRS